MTIITEVQSAFFIGVACGAPFGAFIVYLAYLIAKIYSKNGI